MKDRTVAVIGLGLIGGSLARDLHALGARVIGFDTDPDTLRDARREGVIDAALPHDWDGIEAADIVVLAVPVPAAPDLIHRLAQRSPATLVTDACSTKRAILEAALNAGIGDRFVGAHPLAGSHQSGWSASRTGLFRDCTTFLCPTPHSGPRAIALSFALWTSIGARPRIDDAADHDHRVAWLSHLPQVCASSLALTISTTGLTAPQMGPGGRDSSRLANSDPDLWTGILMANADQVEPAIEELERSLAAVRDALQRRDGPALARLLGAARRWVSNE